MENLVFGIKLHGTLGEFSWETEYTVEGLEQIDEYVLEMKYEDDGSSDNIRCTIYRDGDFNLHCEIKCSVEISIRHLNYLAASMFEILRENSVANDECVVSNDTTDYDSLTYMIDCIGMIHAISNIVNK